MVLRTDHSCRSERLLRNSIAFGDFRRGYLIVDRQGVRVIRDPFTAKPYVLFYTTKRVGGGVQDFDAIKLLKFSVS
jgi:HK97 family phage major capsid protein